MTHHHLGFKITDSVKRNAYHNKHRCAAEGNIDSADAADEYWQDSDNAYEYCTHERYS